MQGFFWVKALMRYYIMPNIILTFYELERRNHLS